jgi:hypothetical protein
VSVLIKKLWNGKFGEYFVHGLIALALIGFFVFPIVKGVIEDYRQDNEVVTNKEMQEFKKWEQKQNQKEYENSNSNN